MSNINLINPFNYLPYIGDNESLEFLNHNSLNNSNRKALEMSSYYSNSNESNTNLNGNSVSSLFNNEKSSQSLANDSNVDYYYHNCVVDILLKLFTRTFSEKFTIVKFLIDLMPHNSELNKQFVWLSMKFNGLHKTVQAFYDHLSINLVDNEHLWIL